MIRELGNSASVRNATATGMSLAGWLSIGLSSLYLSMVQAAPATVLALVNQSAITQQHLNDAVQLALLNGRQVDTPALRQTILDELIVTEVMYQAAKKQDLNQKDEVKRALIAMQKKLLAEAWLADSLSQNPITDAELQQEYQRQVNLIKAGRNANEYQVSHIMVADEAQAQQIIKRLKSGEAFSHIAATLSLDQYSAPKGGTLNWMIPDQLLSPIGDTVVTMPKGQTYPYPVKSNLGWHIVKLEDVRSVYIPSLEQIKTALLHNMVEDRKTQIIELLIKQSSIEPTPSVH